MTHIVSTADYLKDIYHQTCLIQTSLERYSKDDFDRDEFCQNAFIRSLEIIGEATKNIPADFRESHPDIPWRGMAGLRDVLIHNYGGIDTQHVWYVLTTLIPELSDQLSLLFMTEIQE